MRNKKIIYILFVVVMLSTYTDLAWTAAGKVSPSSYNILMGAIFTCFALLHGSIYAGRKSIIFLAVFACLVSFLMEYAGVKTGLIYGEYHYGNVLGKRILDTVPFLIPLSWFMFMYVSTVTVDAAFGGRYAGSVAPLLFAMLDSAAMTAVDVLVDPIWVTRGTWVWSAVQSLPARSVFYGIPVQNYFGWLLTTMIIFVPYRIIFYRNSQHHAVRDRDFFLPCLIYASIITVGSIESWTTLANTGIIFVALMTGGVLSLAALIGYLGCRANRVEQRLSE